MASVIGRVNTLIIDLKTNSCLPTFYDEVDVLGYRVVNDGGGGKFYWDAVSEETSNDATIVAITGVTIGRWKRVMNGPNLKVEWFGAYGNGENDDTEFIQNCLNYFPSSSDINFTLPLNSGSINFPREKTYRITDSLILSSHQTINFNNCKILYDGPNGKSCMKRNYSLDQIFPKIELNDLLLETKTNYDAENPSIIIEKEGIVGVDMYGMSFSCVKNARIILKGKDSIGINLEHGDTGNKQCYFNVIENSHIFMGSESNTKGIYIGGTPGISGANHNRVIGGEISGLDEIGIHIAINKFPDNTGEVNSVGNLISNVDFEAFALDNSSTAIKCDSASNYFENNHIETYSVLYDFSRGGNIVLGGTKSGNGNIIDTANNIYLGLDKNSNGMIQVIGKANNNYNLESAGGTRQVLVSDFNCNQIFENVSTNANSRNYGMLSVWDGNEFEFRISKIKGGNPVVTSNDPNIGGQAIWRANQHRHFEVENNLKIKGIPEYLNNTAAYNDGWLGYLWQTPSGEVRVCKVP